MRPVSDGALFAGEYATHGFVGAASRRPTAVDRIRDVGETPARWGGVPEELVVCRRLRAARCRRYQALAGGGL